MSVVQIKRPREWGVGSGGLVRFCLFSVVVVVDDRFYIALFSSLEQIHCALVATCDSE